VNGVKLPHFLIWCFAGAADWRPPIALPGVPTAMTAIFITHFIMRSIFVSLTHVSGIIYPLTNR